VRNKYQRQERKSNHKLEVVGGQELVVRVPLPMAEVWAEMQSQVEQLTGQAGLQILRAILEEEVTRRVGPSVGLGSAFQRSFGTRTLRGQFAASPSYTNTCSGTSGLQADGKPAPCLQ